MKIKILEHLNIWNKIKSSIRLQLLITFILCIVSATILLIILSSSGFFLQSNRIHTFKPDIGKIQNDSKEIIATLETSYKLEKDDKIEAYINNVALEKSFKIAIADLNGRLLFSSKNFNVGSLSLFDVLKNENKGIDFNEKLKKKGFVNIYTLNFKNTKAYILISTYLDYDYLESIIGVNGLVYLLSSMAIFIITFYLLTRRKMRYLKNLSIGLKEISKGNLDFKFKQKRRDEFGSLANSINDMSEQLKIKIEEERLIEKSKSELIANISHDLRTPLTSIMGYLKLIKDRKYEDAEKMAAYVDIAYVKSEKLKVLIDGLFEYTKLSNARLELKNERVCINELISQLMEELVPVCEENHLSFTKEFKPEKYYVLVDPDMIARVFENIFSNAIRYGLPPSQIKVNMFSESNYVTVCVKNKANNASSEDLLHLFDRFYRIEKSRSSSQGGSGLGLAIAKSIIELHHGKIWAEYIEDEICMFVQLKLI